jgi:hypothetical protein
VIVLGLFDAFKKKEPIQWKTIPKALYDAERKAVNRYYKGMDEVEKRWSVLYNLGNFNGQRAKEFEILCHDNIKDYYAMLDAQKACGRDTSTPIRVPAYVRLAMLYEKREEYENAIVICATAIKIGATLDGGRTQMQGRLARLIKKHGGHVDASIIKLLDS